MSSEIFRFVSIRPPQDANDGKTSDNVVDLGFSTSPLIDSLRKIRTTGDGSAMTSLVAKFILSAEFIDSPRKFDKTLLDFTAALRRLPEQDFWTTAGQAFTGIFHAVPADFVTIDAFTTPYVRTAESIVAAIIDGSVSPKVRALLVRSARGLWLIRRLADAAPLSGNEFVSAPLVLPGGIFPLPVTDIDLKDQSKAVATANKVNVEARQKRLAQLAADLASNRLAIDELLNTFERTGAQPAAAPAIRSTVAQAIQPLAGFLLPEDASKALTDVTKGALKKIGIAVTQIDVTKSVTLLEKQSASIAGQLYAAVATKGTMVRIGNRIIPKDALAGGVVVAVDPAAVDARSPGPCSPVIDTTLPDDSVTVPAGHGEARILGIADLMVVEQELLRYQLGEIAHIENVLKSEVRSRKFKTTDTLQQTNTAETETTQDKEQDLASTERFALQTESQTVINQNASKSAGLTIHASYGPSVDATANYNAATSTSTEQSNTASSSYAREITTKAVERVQTRTLTRRTVTTIHVIEEVNEHGFDNKTGTSDIVGVYRFLDKIYRAQIVNYGKRLMLEFIIPEPAAFLRYALTNKPVDNVSQVNPDAPGYCLANGSSFVPLQATDITRDNYLYWTSKYGAQDVMSPLPSVAVASGSKKSPDSMPRDGDKILSSDLFDITIPDGYLAQIAFVNIYGETQHPTVGDHRVVFQLQDQQGIYIELGDDNHTYNLHLQSAPTLTVTVNSICFYNYEVLVTVFCTLSTEKFQDWQLKTFASIMNAYNDLKSAYDQAIQEAKLKATDSTVSATNPENNRVTEQTELKKGCISLLTGQRFDLFNSVNRNVAPYGYPEINFAEAKAEGTYIQVFEQSFEWNNMVYVFYPYFWGKKDDWVTIAQLTDNDPLFGQFLRAGAARVQVPVRLGFEEAILTYLSTGKFWAGEGTVVNSDDGDADTLHLSIIDELKSQTGNNNIDGVGTLSVTKNSGTVSGRGTAFTTADENKRIVIAGTTYVIKTVQGMQNIKLTVAYAGDSAEGLGYSMGGKLIGQPWEVKVPTDLIKLDRSLTII
jgi:hypothetical protein